jgi:hypothetical protein
MTTTLVFLTTPGAGSFTVPAGWTAATFDTIGGGGGGGKGDGSHYDMGGGGGGWSSSGSLTVTPGTVCAYSVGAGGTASTTPVTAGGPGGDSWIASNNTATAITSSGVVSGAKGGVSGAGGTPNNVPWCLGGQASAGVGATKFSGGNAGLLAATNQAQTAGGGAAGPNGSGGNGGSAGGGAFGGGGGGNGGGTNGGNQQVPTASFGGNGGNNHSGVGGGVAQTSTAATAGGGGFGCDTGDTVAKPGSNGTEYDATHGSGGGGGSASSGGTGTGSTGGLYGGGAGAANVGNTQMPGAQGLIIITGTLGAVAGPSQMFFAA